MALPPCPTLSVSDQGATIRMPGGPVLSVAVPQSSPSNLAVAKNLMTQANAGLAPLAPVFNIIDAVLSIKDFAEAVPDLLTNPTAVVDAVTELVEKVDKLASLVPQLSVPILAVDVIDAVLLALDGVVKQLEAVVAQQVKINAAAAKATEPGNEALADVVSCAQDLNDQVLADLIEGAGPINQLILVLNLLLQVAGLDPLPPLDDLGEDAEGAVETLSDAVATLQTLRDAIPIP